jgi:transcriptional regulator with XRE-family HTH domain
MGPASDQSADIGIGAIMRTARRARGLTLAQLGQRTAYSASQISRYERGLAPLTVTVLRRFAAALGLPPQIFGLLPAPTRPDAPIAVNPHPERTRGLTVMGEQWEDGEDRVRRRELLAGAAGLAGAAALGLPASADAGSPQTLAVGLENLLYGGGADAAYPAPLSALRTATAGARELFQSTRYGELGDVLPALIATATATRDRLDGDERLRAEALLADAYTIAANFMTKLNDDQLAWATADRAVQTATASGDRLALADARRSVATVLRRTGRPAKGRELLLAAAHGIEPGAHADPDELSMYGTLLQTAAYTAAVDGNRSAAAELIAEAEATAVRLGRDANHRHLAFGPTNVTLYQISIAQVLGDNGTAIECAGTLRPAAIPTRERQGRYWIDVARAYHQWGKPDDCFDALLSAERAAPAEVRYRPPVHRMARHLLRTNRRGSLPGLRAFATRIGLPA